MKLPVVQDKSVLITGCSSGIGRATARVLRSRGWRVLATARKPKDIESLRAEGFDAFALDVAEAASVERAPDETLKRLNGRLGALVNNAGYGQAGAIEDVPRDVLRRQFEVNVFGLQDLTNRLLPAMLRQGWGRIVHITSVLGRVAIPMFGSYCASKHAVEALADAQRVELRGTGVGVSVIEPGPIITSFRDNTAAEATTVRREGSRFAGFYAEGIARRIAEKKSDFFAQPPEAVARKIVHALESPRPRARYRVTVPAYLAPLAHTLAGDAIFDWVVARRLPR